MCGGRAGCPTGEPQPERALTTRENTQTFNQVLQKKKKKKTQPKDLRRDGGGEVCVCVVCFFFFF